MLHDPQVVFESKSTRCGFERQTNTASQKKGIEMPTVTSDSAMVCSVDRVASLAGVEMLRNGGSAVDAAIATNAVLAVTTQHMCGLGGDLFALVHHESGPPAVLNASGRSGSGANADLLRSQGHTEMVHRGEISSVPVPGCVDGWIALHARFGRLPLAELLQPSLRLAIDGFEASPLLAALAPSVAEVGNNTELRDIATGAVVRRPGIARSLEAIGSGGRDGFYGGEFGEALLAMGDGQYSADDLARVDAEWVEPLGVEAFGHRIWTAPPNSQGYLSLASAWIADRVGTPHDSSDPMWAHLLIEASRAAAFDRGLVLSDRADGQDLISPERLGPRSDRIESNRSVNWGDSYSDGGTIYLCATDSDGMGVSLIQSNCRDFGSYLVAGDTGIFLHNRGIGFSLEQGHPAEYLPGRRPPHTLSPALVTTLDGELKSVLGTMGGDAQPQVVLQMLARMLQSGESPGDVIDSGRFVLRNSDPKSGFDTWSDDGEVQVALESDTPANWADDLAERGHNIAVLGGAGTFGHAHCIVRDGTGWAGAADPRSVVGAAISADL